MRCTGRGEVRSVTSVTLAELKDENNKSTINKIPAEEDEACVGKEMAAGEGFLDDGPG